MRWTPGGESQDSKIAAMDPAAEAAFNFGGMHIGIGAPFCF